MGLQKIGDIINKGYVDYGDVFGKLRRNFALYEGKKMEIWPFFVNSLKAHIGLLF